MELRPCIEAGCGSAATEETLDGQVSIDPHMARTSASGLVGALDLGVEVALGGD